MKLRTLLTRTFTWSAPGGNPDSLTGFTSFFTVFHVRGLRPITLTVCDSNGCASGSDSVTVVGTDGVPPTNGQTTGEAKFSLHFTRSAFTCATVPQFDSDFDAVRTGNDVRMTEVGSPSVVNGTISATGHLLLSNDNERFDLTLSLPILTGTYFTQQGPCSAWYDVTGLVTVIQGSIIPLFDGG